MRIYVAHLNCQDGWHYFLSQILHLILLFLSGNSTFYLLFGKKSKKCYILVYKVVLWLVHWTTKLATRIRFPAAARLLTAYSSAG